jgi:hypothetical protein
LHYWRNRSFVILFTFVVGAFCAPNRGLYFHHEFQRRTPEAPHHGKCAMKTTPVHALVLAAFVIAGGPALAEFAPTSPRPAAPAALAETDPPPADQASTAQQARAEVREWRVKLDAFGDSAKTHSSEAWKTASENLNAAWIKTREASTRLEAAAATDWKSAGASYRQASEDLAAKWTKVCGDLK